jgi:signal peptide peptidase SppA
MKQLRHVIAAVNGRPWYVIEETLDTIHAIVQMHVEGARLSPDEIQARLDIAAAASGPRRGARTVGSVGIVPVYGIIMPRATLMTEMSGGATVAGIRLMFRQALEDETIGSILLDFDSPGGAVDGIEELATEIREARGRKPIVAIADYCMASAAYYLASQADEVVASPSSQVGWVGTIFKHTEFSKMNEMDGVTVTVIRNPPGKSQVNDVEALTEEAKADLQQRVDDYSVQFHSAVAKGRGVSVAAVKADYGGGGGMTAARAKAAGLVDRVESYDATVHRLATGRGPAPRGTSALVDLTDLAPDGTRAEFDTSPLLRGKSNQGGHATPADDPDADATEDAGTPPDATAQIADAGDLDLRKLKLRARSR